MHGIFKGMNANCWWGWECPAFGEKSNNQECLTRPRNIDVAAKMPKQAERIFDESSSDAQQTSAWGTIDRAFERQVDLSPGNVAVQLGTTFLTYRELDNRSNKLAQILRRYVRGPDSCVAIYCDRSVDMIVAMLATLKAGAAYLPIDPSNPQERVETVLADASPAVILTQNALVGSLQRSAIPVVSLDGERETIDREDATGQAGSARPTDLAYVIYTSGSTGKPKGVMVTHRNVVRLLTATAHWFNFDADDVWTLFHSSAFDFSVWEIWGCLLTGGRLVIVPYGITRSPRDFYELLEKERVTILNQTPAAFYQIIHVEASGPARALALRYVIFGGEALNFVALRPWFERHGDAKPRLVNMYGITETTVHVMYRAVSAQDSQDVRSLIGEPIPDLRIYLLDANLRPVPIGEVGEIYVGGAGVARGYLKRPDLSAERFIPDPFADQADSKMYKSGDLARSTGNGDIEYLGRSDSQVKIRGFRIELGEIEAALAEHAGVRQTVVAARKDGEADQRLVAYFVRRTERPTTETELRAFLRAKLPEHMVPYAYIGLDAFPLTVNGKIDREALPAPRRDAAPAPATSRESTPAEQTVIDVWRKTLDLERVDLDDNFFDLGGTSIMIVRAHADLEVALQAKIPMTDLFEFPTVRSLARQLSGAESGGRTLSDAQQRAQRQRAAFIRHRERQSGRTP
jgi:amino acid adenylation domain-containing protein